MRSRQFERAEAMVYADKFNLRRAEFFEELKKLVSNYMEYDSLAVELTRGPSANLIVTVSVKKVRPTFRT